jgi:uncharacterized damage-inducible protein DinB
MDGIRTRECLNDLSRERVLTLASVMPLSQAQLDFSPRPGRWSIGEIVDHLLLAERLYRDDVAQLAALARAGQAGYRRHSFSDVNVAPLHLPDAVLSWLEVPFGLASRLLPDRVRDLLTEFPILPTRNPDVATPRPNRPASELKRDLATSMAATCAVVESNGDLDLEALVSEHPLTGRANVARILTFLAQHERRHQRQMEAVRSDPRFPRR